ncbi:hypothetical protein NMG60_11036028 [Bertholletia excelsa]
MGSIPDLPMNIMSEIISRLPVRSLLRFKLVCKTWYALITDSHFISKHLHDYNSYKHQIIFKSLTTSILTDCISLYNDETSGGLVGLHTPFLVSEYNLVGSCHGLICLFPSYGSGFPISLWNPATREFRILPNHRQAIRDGIRHRNILGFGFDPASGDYKVVAILREIPFSVDCTVRVLVWRMSRDCWDEVDSAFLNQKLGSVTRYRISAYMPVIMEGILYWVAHYFSSPTERFIVVVYFDLRDEKFGQISIPHLDESVCFTRLVEFKGCLALCAQTCDFRPDKGHKQFDIWVKDKHDASWTKHFSIVPSPTLVIPIGCYRNSLVVQETAGDHPKLLLHDPDAREQWKELPIPDVSCGCRYEVFSYVESLVPLRLRATKKWST